MQLTFHSEMQLSASSPFRTHLNLSKEKSHVRPIYCSPPSSPHPSSTHPQVFTQQSAGCAGDTWEKGAAFSEKHPQQVASPGLKKSWPFQLLTSGLLVLPQQLVLDSIQIHQMTLRKGCKLPREERTHFKGSRWSRKVLRCEQWTRRHSLVRFQGEWIHMYLWLSPFTVHLKLSQYC